MRIGTGYDVHKLVKGRKLYIGGEYIPFEKGALGHSDADVLIHAVCDALLGAIANKDIGRHFPDNDDTYKDISGIELLKLTRNIIKENGYKIGNIDSTIILEKPKIENYILKMRENIAGILETSVENISIKATTNEGMGFIGEGKGIAAHAVAILTKR